MKAQFDLYPFPGPRAEDQLHAKTKQKYMTQHETKRTETIEKSKSKTKTVNNKTTKQKQK